jgi:hypothetical protein
MVAAHHGDAERLVPGEHLRGGMAIPAAVADLDDRRARLHGGEEGGGRGCPAAMVRHEQHVAAQCRGDARAQRVLLRRLDVAGQQRAAACGIDDAQDAADGIGLHAGPVVAGCRVQHLEADAVPGPRLAGLAARVRHRTATQRMAGFEGAAQHGHRQAVEDGPRTADMVGVRVAQHERVDPRLAARMQQWEQYPPAGVVVRPEARAGVEQQQVPAGANQHRAALPHVGGEELEAPRRRPRHAGREQRQQQGQAQRPHAPGQWQHQQRAPGEAGDEAPGGRGRDVHAGPGPRSEDLQQCQQRAQGQRTEMPERRQHAARERERRHDQRDPRLGHEVRGQADERDLLEGHQGQRGQAEARDDLGAGTRAQCAAPCAQCAVPCAQSAQHVPLFAQGARPRVPWRRRRPAQGWRGTRGLRSHQQADRRERQPEAGLQQRPRVERGDRHHRGQRHQQCGPVPAEAAQQCRRREHQHGAARRHAPAREQRVAPRDGDPAPACRQRRGQEQRRVPGPPPEAPDGSAAQPRQHRDVQARDADQVRDAGVAEQLPAGAADRGLVADGQRREDAGSARLGDREEDAVPHGLARTLDRREALFQQASRAAHAARRAQALLEQPQLGIEAFGVQHAVRHLQAHGQAPPLARADRRRRVGHDRVFARRAAPAQPDAPRDAGGACVRVPIPRAPGGRQRARRFDDEREALAVLRELRHLVDHADELELPPLPLGRERVRQARVGPPARGGEGEAERGGQCEEPRGGSGGPEPGRPAERERGRRQQPIGVPRPQRGLLQLQRRAGHPGQHQRRPPGRAQRMPAQRRRADTLRLRARPDAGLAFPAHPASLGRASGPTERRSAGFAAPCRAARRTPWNPGACAVAAHSGSGLKTRPPPANLGPASLRPHSSSTHGGHACHDCRNRPTSLPGIGRETR